MKDIKQRIASDIVNVMATGSLSKQEEAILTVLTDRWGDRNVTQKEIAESRFWKDAVGTEESDSTMETKTRTVRRYIRNLRVKHKIAILHDERGHYLPETEQDLEDFIVRLEQEAKGRAASSMETYKTMKETLGVSSPLFEQLDFVGTQLIKRV